MECEQSTQIDEMQDEDGKDELFTNLKNLTVQGLITKEDKTLKTKKKSSNCCSSDLSHTNGIIACVVIVPYQQDNTFEAIQEYDIKEIQENKMISEDLESKFKKIDCEANVELYVNKVEEKNVNVVLNIIGEKIAKIQQPSKRRGRPKKIYNFTTPIGDTTPNQHEKIPLEGIEPKLSTISKKFGKFNRNSHEGFETLIPNEAASCIHYTQPLNKSEVFEQNPFPSKMELEVVEGQIMGKKLIDLQPSPIISTNLEKKLSDVLVVEESHMHKRKLGQDGKPRNRAVMDILGLGVEMPKVERVFTRKRLLEVSTSFNDKYNNNSITKFSLPFCKQMKNEDSNELTNNRCMVSHQPSKRSRGRPRKWPLKDISKKDCSKVNIKNEIILKSTHELYTNYHGKRTNRKKLVGNKSLGCARCSIQGWAWRRWTRNGAKHRLRKKIQEFASLGVSFQSIASANSTLQSARTNRATLRKLVSAAEGSDKMKFNQLKVRLNISWYLEFQNYKSM